MKCDHCGKTPKLPSLYLFKKEWLCFKCLNKAKRKEVEPAEEKNFGEFSIISISQA